VALSLLVPTIPIFFSNKTFNPCLLSTATRKTTESNYPKFVNKKTHKTSFKVSGITYIKGCCEAFHPSIYPVIHPSVRMSRHPSIHPSSSSQKKKKKMEEDEDQWQQQQQ
jgi:hypothetical protein